MLTKFHKILLGLLAAQLVLVVIVLTRADDSQSLKEHVLIPGFDVAKVTRVQVSSSGEGAKTVDLVKRDAGWVVASAFDYPGDQTLSLIHISEPTRLLSISYAVFCLKKKKKI